MFVLCLYGAMVVAETEVEIHQETEEDGNTPSKKYRLVPDRITPAETGRDGLRYVTLPNYATLRFDFSKNTLRNYATLFSWATELLYLSYGYGRNTL